MEVATTPTTTTNPIVPEGVATTKQEAERIKRGKGRPPKPFISELPVPPKFEMSDVDQFFEYLRSIPTDKLQRILLVFYRYLPVCDMTENGEKDKYLEKIAGESHPFIDEDWEKQVLHRYGSGIYGVYLNEMNRTICRCLKIETKWDLDNYPPIVDPQWVDQDHPQNRAYIQYLRSRGVKLPTKNDKEQEENEMQVGEAMKTMADTVSQLAMRQNIPTPTVTSPSDKLTLEAATATIGMVTKQAELLNASKAREDSPMELVNSIVSVAEKMNGNGKNNGDDTMKLFMADVLESRREASKRAAEAEDRHARLMEKMFTQQTNPTSAKSATDSLKETLELMTMIKEIAGGNGKGEAEEAAPAKSDWVGALIQNGPQLMQYGVQAWGQFNQTMAQMTRMKELDLMKTNGQVPTGAQSPMPQQATPQPPQQVQANPDPAQPQLTEAQAEQQRQDQITYGPFHPLIGMIGQPLITHLNDPEKDGYDFAEWFIAGQGRLMYDQVKGIGSEKLMGAVKSYAPLWQQIGGVEPKVKEFIGEFLTLDEFLANQPTEGEGDKS